MICASSVKYQLLLAFGNVINMLLFSFALLLSTCAVPRNTTSYFGNITASPRNVTELFSPNGPWNVTALAEPGDMFIANSFTTASHSSKHYHITGTIIVLLPGGVNYPPALLDVIRFTSRHLGPAIEISAQLVRDTMGVDASITYIDTMCRQDHTLAAIFNYLKTNDVPNGILGPVCTIPEVGYLFNLGELSRPVFTGYFRSSDLHIDEPHKMMLLKNLIRLWPTSTGLSESIVSMFNKFSWDRSICIRLVLCVFDKAFY